MKIRTRKVRVLAIAAAMTIAVPLAGITRGQAPAGGLVISPVVDAATQQKATELGAVLLSKAKWSTAQANPPTEMAAVGQTLLGYGRFYKTVSLDLQTGHLQWTSKSNGQVPNVATSAMASSDGGLEILHRLQDQLLLKRFAKDTGEESIVWQHPNAPVPRNLLNSPQVFPHATFAGDQVIAAGISQAGGPGSMARHVVIPMSIRSLDRKTGTPQWATEIDGGAAYTSQPLVVAGKVYVTVDQSVYPDFPADIPKGVQSKKSYILALNAKDGKIVWRTPPIEARQFAPVIAGPLLVTGTETGAVVAYDAQTGQERWHVALKTDGNDAVTSLETRDSQLLFHKDQLLVPVNAPWEYPVLPFGRKNWILGAFATVDIHTGKQAGYFGGFSRELSNPFNTTILGVHHDTIVAYVRGTPSGAAMGWCMGINRKRLKLECYIPHTGSATLSNDALYVGARASERNNAPGTIYAVPLAAWDEVKGKSTKP